MKNVMVLWIVCTTWFIQCSGSESNTGKLPVADSVDQRILFAIHNTDFIVANRLIETRIKEFPGEPKYYFLKSSMLYHARYFSDQGVSRDSLKQLLANYCQQTINRCEKLPETTENKFFLGSAYGYLSRVHVMSQSLTDAYFAAKKANGYFEDVIEENPYFYDAYLSPAVAEYFVATRANWWQSGLAFLSGFENNKDNAINSLRLVQEKSLFNKDEATFILSRIYQFLEPNPDNARYYTQLYHESFPGNRFMTTELNSIRLTDIIVNRGVLYFSEHADSLTALYSITNAGTLNAVGYRLINENKPQDALLIFQANLKLFPETANCYDSLAECYSLLGKKGEAIQYYTQAYEKTLTDKSIGDQFRKTLQDGIQEKLKELRK
ncbi:tetratricopeptide repeat protein [bacterium]|nr:tetratricopeptide repeat protein [bacterium]